MELLEVERRKSSKAPSEAAASPSGRLLLDHRAGSPFPLRFAAGALAPISLIVGISGVVSAFQEGSLTLVVGALFVTVCVFGSCLVVVRNSPRYLRVFDDRVTVTRKGATNTYLFDRILRLEFKELSHITNDFTQTSGEGFLKIIIRLTVRPRFPVAEHSVEVIEEQVFIPDSQDHHPTSEAWNRAGEAIASGMADCWIERIQRGERIVCTDRLYLDGAGVHYSATRVDNAVSWELITWKSIKGWAKESGRFYLYDSLDPVAAKVLFQESTGAVNILPFQFVVAVMSDAPKTPRSAEENA
jgi:hypothetical protein